MPVELKNNDMEKQWGQMKLHARARWTKLTEEDVNQVAGNRGLLVAKIRERYALSAQDAEKQVQEFRDTFLGNTQRT
jgi:uncharacterized protein YjbJ (UPF0337 family)